MWEGGYVNIEYQYLYLSPDTCLLRPQTQSFTGGECMELKNMSTLFQPTALVGAIAIAMGFSTTVSAQQTSEPTVNATLETLVVTATRSEEKIANVPARISIIEPAILEQSPIASLPNILKKEAALNVAQLGGYGQQSSIFLRGTSSTHTLLLRDGVRLNTASSSSASLPFIDTTDIKQIEILKGAASVLYGTDAIGGVIQMVSKTPEKTGAFVTGEIGENKTYKSIIGADLAENDFYAQIRGQRLETDGKSVLNTEDLNYSFDQQGFSTKLGIDKENYAASLDYSQNEGTGDYNAGALASQNFDNEIINLKGRVNVNSDLELNARLSQFKDSLDQRDLNYLNQIDYAHSQTQEAEIYGKYNLNKAQNILLGTTYSNLDGDVLSYGTAYKGDVSSVGYYGQHQLQSEKLNTQIGVRVEDNEKYGSHTVGQAAARYFVHPSFSLYTNIGTAFRSPNLNELYSGESANPDLKPEESLSYEIGLDQALTQNASVSLSIYQNEVENMIQKESGKLTNINEAKLRGGEVSFHWQNNEWFVDSAYAYVQAKDGATKQELPKRPRQTLTFTTGLQNEVYGISASLIARSKSKSWSSSNDNPGYATIDLNAYWNIHPNVKVFTNIENVGDVRHEIEYNYNNYYIDEGRLASAGITFKY